MAITKPTLPPKAGYVEVEVGGVRTYLDLGNPKIATGSYIGTGTYGASNPNSLTFDFEPKIVMIQDPQPAYVPVTTIIRPTNRVYRGNQYTGDHYGDLRFTWTDNGISWYNTTNETYQMNSSSCEYPYIAIG